jgi:hypothetical protein
MLDIVGGWSYQISSYEYAAQYMKQNPVVLCCVLSTDKYSSTIITKGQQYTAFPRINPATVIVSPIVTAKTIDTGRFVEVYFYPTASISEK